MSASAKVMKWPKLKLKFNIRQIFTVIAIGMWTISFLANLINPNYDPPEYVNPMIMLVGGYLFATNNKDNGSKDNKDKENK